MEEDQEITELSRIQNKIYTIRGKQVMIDSDLAELYGVKTKVLNQAVKRNIERFPEEFRFQITPEEKEELVTNCDHFEKLKFSPTLPYAFTEQGVAMLSIRSSISQCEDRAPELIEGRQPAAGWLAANQMPLARQRDLESRATPGERAFV